MRIAESERFLLRRPAEGHVAMDQALEVEQAGLATGQDRLLDIGREQAEA
jgi:hypothetical protein